MSTHTTHTRDAALRQLRRLTRWLIAGSILLTGVLTDVAANAFPGKTARASAHGRAKATSTRAEHRSASPGKKSTGSLKPPARAPEASPEPRSSSESTSSEESPAGEPASGGEPAATPEPTHAEEPAASAEPASESAPAPEPAPEVSEPVVSGGS
jgi:hypothetical protein